MLLKHVIDGFTARFLETPINVGGEETSRRFKNAANLRSALIIWVLNQAFTKARTM